MAERLKKLPDDVIKEVWRLKTDSKWSTRKIAAWLREKGYEVSHEWVRQLLEALAASSSPNLPVVTEAPVDPIERQLLRMQEDAYKTALYKARIGDAGGQEKAVRTFLHTLEKREARQKIASVVTIEAPATAAPVAGDQAPQVLRPSFKGLLKA